MTWKIDPPTQKQIRYLRQLGCSAIPQSKGEACDLIAARVPKRKAPDQAEIVDKACERARKSLANGEGYYREVDGVLIPPRARYERLERQFQFNDQTEARSTDRRMRGEGGAGLRRGGPDPRP